MSSLLKIKPTRREIITLIGHKLQEVREQKARAIAGQISEIEQRQKARLAAWERECAKLSAKEVKTTSPELNALRRAAKRLGLIESPRRYNSGQTIDFVFSKTITLDVPPVDLPERPNYTVEEAAEVQRLRQHGNKLQGQVIDGTYIVAHLVENNGDLLQEVEAVARRISDNVESQSVKLIEGTVE